MDIWRIESINYDEAEQRNLIAEIYSHENNGFVVTGFLSSDEVAHALENLQVLDKSSAGAFTRGEGYSIPKSFSMLSDISSRDKVFLDAYIDSVRSYNKRLSQIFSFDLEARLFAYFKRIGGAESVRKVEVGQKESNTFPSSTVRVCYPDKGGIPIHVGNMFFSMYPEFYGNIEKQIGKNDQLSYFILLSKPDSGGRVILYNATWPKYVSISGDDLVSSGGAQKRIEDFNTQFIDLSPGDLLLFDGGNIWHRVENLSGGKDRVTVGGFVSMSDNKGMYVWA